MVEKKAYQIWSQKTLVQGCLSVHDYLRPKSFPCLGLTFSSIKWERAHLSHRFAARPDVSKELYERE